MSGVDLSQRHQVVCWQEEGKKATDIDFMSVQWEGVTPNKLIVAGKVLEHRAQRAIATIIGEHKGWPIVKTSAGGGDRQLPDNIPIAVVRWTATDLEVRYPGGPVDSVFLWEAAAWLQGRGAFDLEQGFVAQFMQAQAAAQQQQAILQKIIRDGGHRPN